MQKDKNNRLIYSASDLVNFTLCPSITLYDLQHSETPWKRRKRTPMHKFFSKRGSPMKNNTWTRLKKTGRTVADIATLTGGSIPAKT
jgi:hypothetical protein